jgi:hypothetical protein
VLLNVEQQQNEALSAFLKSIRKHPGMVSIAWMEPSMRDGWLRRCGASRERRAAGTELWSGSAPPDLPHSELTYWSRWHLTRCDIR